MNDVTIHNTMMSVYCISICTYLWIDTALLWLYTLLLIIDFITWIIKWFIHKNLESRIAVNWVFKKLILILLIFSIWATWKIIEIDDISWLLGFAFSSLAIAELYSILANIYEIRTWKKTKEFDWVSFIISWILRFIESKIKNLDSKQTKNDEWKM